MNLFRKSKQLHSKNCFEENKLNSFKIWHGIKEIINLHGQPKNIPN